MSISNDHGTVAYLQDTVCKLWQEIALLRQSLDFYKKRCDTLQAELDAERQHKESGVLQAK